MGEGSMIKIFRKNQMLFLVLGLILVTAGYLNYTYTPEIKYRTELTGNIDDSLGDTIYVNAFKEDSVETSALVDDINVESNTINNDEIKDKKEKKRTTRQYNLNNVPTQNRPKKIQEKINAGKKERHANGPTHAETKAETSFAMASHLF